MKTNNPFASLGEIFTPLFPGFMTAGLCAGFSALFKQIFPSLSSSVIPFTLDMVNNAFSTYIPVWVGWQAAGRYGAHPVLCALLAMFGLMDEIDILASFLPEELSFLLHSGSGGVLAIIAGAWLLGLLESFFTRKLPESIRSIFAPFFSFIIVLVPYVVIVMPFFGLLSDMICNLISAVIFSDSIVVRLITGYICAALFLPANLFGLNYAFIAIYLVQLEESGSISLYPVLAMAGASQVGMGLAVSMKSGKKNTNLKTAALSGIVPGLLGVGAPLLYGVSLAHIKLLITSCIGAGFGGAFIVASGVASTGWGPSGLLALPLMSGGSSSPLASMAFYFAGLIVSYIGGFTATMLMVNKEELMNERPLHESDQDIS